MAAPQADLHPGGRAMLTAGKSASGLLVLIGGLFAGVQALIAAGGLVFHCFPES
jgi:hypothetical protein